MSFPGNSYRSCVSPYALYDFDRNDPTIVVFRRGQKPNTIEKGQIRKLRPNRSDRWIVII